jgi:hypothetical protein
MSGMHHKGTKNTKKSSPGAFLNEIASFFLCVLCAFVVMR